MQAPLAITLENFQQVILEDSKQHWLLLQFYMPENEACVQMTQLLSTAVQPYAEHLIYAQVNCQTEQQIAMQFGIQSLPTVMLVKDGQPVDGFAGMADQAAIQALLEKHLPKPEDELLAQAQACIHDADYVSALPLAKQAFALNENNIDARYVLIDCMLENGQVDGAKTLLEPIGLVDQDQRYQILQGKIELAEQAAESPEIKALQAAVEANPEEYQLQVDLAVQLHAAHQTAEALALLFAVVQRDMNFGDAKKTFLDMVNALPDGEPLKSEYRRKMYSLLY
jgi:putative thioredoxin